MIHHKTAAIIPAGGIGKRMGLGHPKQFHELAGVPMLVHTLRAFEEIDGITATIVAVPLDSICQVRLMAEKYRLSKVTVVGGGVLRQDSVQAGLAHVPPDCDFVAVHDGARPLVDADLILRCLETGWKTGAAMAAIPVKDTMKEVDPNGTIIRTVNRENLRQAQTPQVVATDVLRRAFAEGQKKSFIGTDEASFLELINVKMTVVPGSEKNIKITGPEDLLIAEALLMKKEQSNPPSLSPLRIGHGYDAHGLVEGRPLILGGIEISHPTGLLGHSDADVLTHALCDAILGALGEGDLGRHFPDNDPAYKNIESLKLLAKVVETATKQGFRLSNADVTVVAQEPKLAPHFPAMQKKLATVCRVEENQVNLKGTTTERMGFTGRKEGIAAHAVVLLQSL
ncbi:MAG: 2-C-methyl-D-erythritol 4-phosphate cytidylyltransferase [Pseudomonadota bacterium]